MQICAEMATKIFDLRTPSAFCLPPGAEELVTYTAEVISSALGGVDRQTSYHTKSSQSFVYEVAIWENKEASADEIRSMSDSYSASKLLIENQIAGSLSGYTKVDSVITTLVRNANRFGSSIYIRVYVRARSSDARL